MPAELFAIGLGPDGRKLDEAEGEMQRTQQVYANFGTLSAAESNRQRHLASAISNSNLCQPGGLDVGLGLR
jgi:hypothetical protein